MPPAPRRAGWRAAWRPCARGVPLTLSFDELSALWDASGNSDTVRHANGWAANPMAADARAARAPRDAPRRALPPRPRPHPMTWSHPLIARVRGTLHGVPVGTAWDAVHRMLGDAGVSGREVPYVLAAWGEGWTPESLRRLWGQGPGAVGLVVQRHAGTWAQDPAMLQAAERLAARALGDSHPSHALVAETGLVTIALLAQQEAWRPGPDSVRRIRQLADGGGAHSPQRDAIVPRGRAALAALLEPGAAPVPASWLDARDADRLVQQLGPALVARGVGASAPEALDVVEATWARRVQQANTAGRLLMFTPLGGAQVDERWAAELAQDWAWPLGTLRRAGGPAATGPLQPVRVPGFTEGVAIPARMGQGFSSLVLAVAQHPELARQRPALAELVAEAVAHTDGALALAALARIDPQSSEARRARRTLVRTSPHLWGELVTWMIRQGEVPDRDEMAEHLRVLLAQPDRALRLRALAQQGRLLALGEGAPGHDGPPAGQVR